jgi:GNAT superfamily N-acetyltransferase
MPPAHDIIIESAGTSLRLKLSLCADHPIDNRQELQMKWNTQKGPKLTIECVRNIIKTNDGQFVVIGERFAGKCDGLVGYSYSYHELIALEVQDQPGRTQSLYIAELMVVKHSRGRGYGSALLTGTRSINSESPEMCSSPTSHLYVSNQNHDAIRCYCNHGYKFANDPICDGASNKDVLMVLRSCTGQPVVVSELEGGEMHGRSGHGRGGQSAGGGERPARIGGDNRKLLRPRSCRKKTLSGGYRESHSTDEEDYTHSEDEEASTPRKVSFAGTPITASVIRRKGNKVEVFSPTPVLLCFSTSSPV